MTAATAVLLLAAAWPATGASRPPVGLIDGLLGNAFTADHPGASVIVAQNGTVIFHKSYGLANVAAGVPLAVGMPLPLGSVTKQFTAVAILRLVEQGRLRLEDPVRRFFSGPVLPPATVNIEHLLTHTSGIKSYTDLQAWFEKVRADPTTSVPTAEITAMVFQEPLLFPPGTRDGYSNSDYLLLGVVIEKVSGETYERFLARHVLSPLGMKRTFCGSAHGITPALGYRRLGEGWEPQPYLGGGGCTGDGGLAATVEDLVRWDAALRSDVLLSRRSRDRVFRAYELAGGGASRFGYGWAGWNYQGHPFFWHGGYTWGFPSAVIHSPTDGVYVAVVSNNAGPGVDAQYLAKRVATIAIGRPAVEPVPVDVPAETLAAYVGLYQAPGGVRHRVLRDGSQLFTERVGGTRYAAFAESPTRFFYKDSFERITFVKESAGRVTHVVYEGDGRPESWERVGDLKERQAIRLEPSVLESYVGEYEIRAGQVLKITREGDRLFGQPTGGQRDEMFAESEDHFFLTAMDMQFVFVKGADGKSGAVILIGGDWRIEARRVK